MTSHSEIQDEIYSKTVFGFWVYLLTDFVLFGVLFAAYAVLRNSTFGGPSSRDLFYLPFTLTQTFILLVSSLTAGLGGAACHRKNKNWTITLFILTFLLGAAFLGMEFIEFKNFIQQGNSWAKSAFLSAFFTLLATHGLHIFFGLIWMIVLIIPVYLHGLTFVDIRRLTCLRMFWQFLNIIWVFIFTFVYLMGVI